MRGEDEPWRYLQKPGQVADEFIIRPSDMMKEKGWVYLKGAKSEPGRALTASHTNTRKDRLLFRMPSIDLPEQW